MDLIVKEDLIVVKDSLGLGVKKSIPKEKIYTDEENDQFTRQLLSEKEKSDLTIFSISDIRNIIIENSNRDAYDKIDPDLLITVDSRINYNIYIVEDNIYTYEELCTVFPFQEFNISPDSIFIRQIIIIFDDNLVEVINDGDPIISTYDLVKLATAKASTVTVEPSIENIKRPTKIIKSKIFIGGEKWKDFLQLRGFFRGMVQVSNLQIDNGQTPEFLKPFTLAISNQLMLEGGSASDSANSNDSSANASANGSSITSANGSSITSDSNEKKTLEERVQILENIIQALGEKVALLENSR